MEAPQLHMANPDGSPNPDFADALSGLLTSSNGTEACFGRCVAAGITQSVMDWCNAELLRGTDPAVIMVTLIELQVQQVASLAGNFVSAAGTAVVEKHYRTLLDKQFSLHAGRIRAMLATPSAGTEQTG